MSDSVLDRRSLYFQAQNLTDLKHARALIFGKYVHLGTIKTIYKYCHA